MSFLPLVNLWKVRSILVFFAIINIKLRFKGMKLGIVWTALEPTLTFVFLYIVFTSITKGPQENYGIYLLTGIILYNIFARGTSGGLSSIRSNVNIIESININKEFFPVTAVLATSILMVVQIGVFFGLMPFFQFIPVWTIIFLPVVLLLLIILILGISYILCILHVYFRDIQVIWSILIQALFFITPIIWYIDDIKDTGLGNILLAIHSINPIGQLTELTHNIVVFNTIPTLVEWTYVSIFCIGIFLFGFLIFNKYQSKIMEEL
ncbi:MAG: ABC transporter permease [Nitrosopumilus sp.]|nr:ABC transporter permease [Nitrosopumilus sp.]MDH3832638.1 ABC transporter permease [Nitrosopumilus sp.]